MQVIFGILFANSNYSLKIPNIWRIEPDFFMHSTKYEEYKHCKNKKAFDMKWNCTDVNKIPSAGNESSKSSWKDSQNSSLYAKQYSSRLIKNWQRA